MRAWQQQDEVGRKTPRSVEPDASTRMASVKRAASALDDYLSGYPVLGALYEAKQRLNRLLLIRTLNAKKVTAKARGTDRATECQPLASTGWNPQVLAQADRRYVALQQDQRHHGGLHNKMEMMTRRAYGFRNFENYRLRVLTHCGLGGIIKSRLVNDGHPAISG